MEIDHYEVKGENLCAVTCVTKEYGHIGPDPGTYVRDEVIVDGVSHEYGTMLVRELTKAALNRPFRNDRTFTVANTVARGIDMWTGPNQEWGERIDNPIVY